MDFETTNLIPIPLPTEVPKPPALDKLPTDILHSATVEMLIQQNEDLSARLKVNIRRNSLQEQNILKMQKTFHTLSQKNESLKAQMEIVLEKEMIWKTQKKSQHRQMETIEREKQLLELRYNELYTASQFRQKELQDNVSEKNEKVKSLTLKLSRLKRLKERGKDKVRELLLSTADFVTKDDSERRRLQGQNSLYAKNIDQVRERYEEREKFLREKISELSELSKTHLRQLEGKIKDRETQIEIRDKKIHSMENAFQETLTQEIQLERHRQRELEVRIEDLESQLKIQANNRHQIERLSEELANLQNSKIEASRDQNIEIQNLESEREALKVENEKVKKQFHELSTQSFETQKALEACEKKLIQLSEDNQALTKETESLKTLWFDLQEDYEKEQLKTQSLKTLNKTLSQKNHDTMAHKAIEKSHSRSESPTKDIMETVTIEGTLPPPTTRDSQATPNIHHVKSSVDDRIANLYASEYETMKPKNSLDL